MDKAEKIIRLFTESKNKIPKEFLDSIENKIQECGLFVMNNLSSSKIMESISNPDSINEFDLRLDEIENLIHKALENKS